MNATSRCGEPKKERQGGRRRQKHTGADGSANLSPPPLSPPPPPPSGLDAVRGSARVYLEAYTSILMVGNDRLVRGEKKGGT